VLVRDGASFYCTEGVEEIYYKASDNLLYLPPYSPNINLIKEFFAKLTASIKKDWHTLKDALEPGFNMVLDNAAYSNN
jgi:transposase